MAPSSNDNKGYEKLIKSLSEHELSTLYIFHGEERYLLERTLARVTDSLIGESFPEFNHRRFEGAGFSSSELSAAVDTLPVFADRTLIEVWDYDVFGGGDEERKKLTAILTDLPDYVCLIFIFDILAFKPDRRVKTVGEILKTAETVEFGVQAQAKLVKWIRKHVADSGKSISGDTAEYLSFVTGGLMSSLNGEIEKLISYSESEEISKRDIDDIVTAVPDAVSYKLTDALTRKNFGEAASILDNLLRMREAPHKLLYGISLRMRQLLTARVCLENNLGESTFMEISGIRYPFQAKAMLSSARGTETATCKNLVLACSEAAYYMNSGDDPTKQLTELFTKLVFYMSGNKR